MSSNNKRTPKAKVGVWRQCWGMYAQGMTLEEIGKKLGFTKVRAWQIVQKSPALKKLKQANREARKVRRARKLQAWCNGCGRWYNRKSKGQKWCSQKCSREGAR